MAFYIEVICDANKQGQNPKSPLLARCDSDNGDGPNAGIGSGMSGAIGLGLATSEAKRAGWVRKRGVGWVCPGCQS